MKLKNLFQNEDIVFLPIKENLGKMQRALHSYCFRKGYKITVRTGIFIDPSSMEVEKVMRVELLNNKDFIKQKKSLTL